MADNFKKHYNDSNGSKEGARFRQLRDRRKSLGALMDSTEMEKLFLESDYFWQTASNENDELNHTVTGSSEVDTCLHYHLQRTRKCLDVCPFYVFDQPRYILTC